MAEQYASILFGEWLPDQEPYAHQGLVTCRNVLPETWGLGPVPTPSLVASAPAAPYLATELFVANVPGNFNSYLLVQTDGETFYHRVKGATSWTLFYTASPRADAPRFQQWDDQLYFASASSNSLYKAAITSTPSINTASVVSGAPGGGAIARINRFLVLGYLDNTTTPDFYTVRWSGIDDPDDWPTPLTASARAVQSGQQVLNSDDGRIQSIVGTEFYGLVFQNNAITKMSYVGGDIVFTFEKISDGIGSVTDSTAIVGNQVYFFAQDGFYVTDGVSTRPLGRGKVDGYFQSIKGTATAFWRVVSVIGKSQIWFYFIDADSRRRIFVYNYATDRWAEINDAIINNNVLAIVSDNGYSEKTPLIIRSTDDAVYEFTTGTGIVATLETAETSLNMGGRAIVDGVRPIVDGGTVRVEVGSRSRYSDAVEWSTAEDPHPRTGMANFRKEGRYHRVRMTIYDGFDTATGADIEWSGTGRV